MLYLVATPIGNMEDISVRALKTLRGVGLIAAEDTRRTVKLLNHYHIKTSMTSYHEHNRKEKGVYLVRKMEEGIDIALVSDAGTPGISDPGEELVRMAHDKGIRVTLIPGACALINGVVLSGISTGAFIYAGFLPRAKKERMESLGKLKYNTETIVLYEAPHRLCDTLREIREIMGSRKVALARELTKIHEEVIRGDIQQVLEMMENNVRGEYVIVIEGRPADEIKAEGREFWQGITIEEHYRMYLGAGHDRMEAMKRTAADRGLTKREVYGKIKRSGNCQTQLNKQ